MKDNTKEQDLVMLCKLWYVTRQATFGTMMEKDAAEAFTAFDTKVQEVIERQDLH